MTRGIAGAALFGQASMSENGTSCTRMLRTSSNPSAEDRAELGFGSLAAAQELEARKTVILDDRRCCRGHARLPRPCVRLFEGTDFRRTRLVRDLPECVSVSERWRKKLIEERGWQEG